MAIIEITMPALSPTMESGKIVEWKLKEGEAFKNGDILFTIETDKAIMEYETSEDGILGKIVVGNGAENVQVGTVVGYIKENEDDVLPEIMDVTSDTTASTDIAESTSVQMTYSDSATISAQTAENDTKYGKNYFSTPAARARAQVLNIDIDNIVKNIKTKVKERDVIEFHAKSIASNTLQTSTSTKQGPIDCPVNSTQINLEHNVINQQTSHASNHAISNSTNTTSYPLTNMQNIIAQRMCESKLHAPHFYIKSKCCIDGLLELKSKFKAKGVATTLTHWLVSIIAKALQKYPKINAEFINGTVYQHIHSDIALAMSVGDALITPVIRSAEVKTIDFIASDVQMLIDKAKNGALSPQEYQNGSFTISNVGMYGIDECISIINPPQVAIMGVGSFSTELALSASGDVIERNMINVTLSVDHRVVNGSYACEFLRSIKNMIEDPMLMI